MDVKTKKKGGFFRTVGNILKYGLILGVIALTVYGFIYPENTFIVEAMIFFDMEFLMLNSGISENDVMLAIQIFAVSLLIGDIVSKLIKKKKTVKADKIEEENKAVEVEEEIVNVEVKKTNETTGRNRILERLNRK